MTIIAATWGMLQTGLTVLAIAILVVLVRVRSVRKA